jgi:hypothetical protein
MIGNFLTSSLNAVIPRVLSHSSRRVVFLIATLMEVGRYTTHDYKQIETIAKKLNIATEPKSLSFAMNLKPIIWGGDGLAIRTFNENPLTAYGESWGLAARIVDQQPHWTKYATKEEVVAEVQSFLVDAVRHRFNDPTIALTSPKNKDTKHPAA